MKTPEKPCGIDWCPLFDECRFPIEAQEQLIVAGYQSAAIVDLRNLTGHVWCKGHRARGITPSFSVCREVLGRVVTGMVTAREPRPFLAALLRDELAEREQSIPMRLFTGAPF